MGKSKWIVFAKKIDAISNWIGKIFSYLVLPLTALIVFEVITRRFFDAPTIWTFELSNFLFGVPFHAGCRLWTALQGPCFHRSGLDEIFTTDPGKAPDSSAISRCSSRLC